MTKLPITAEDLARGKTVREPPGNEKGYWAGAPDVFIDPSDGGTYLTYRLRRPRGVEPDRGGESRIARCVRGQELYEDIWGVTKDAYASASIERCALWRRADGRWFYFPSYVNPEDGRWCVDVISADDIHALNTRARKPLFRASDLNLEGIKDPWIFEEHGRFYMFLSVALPTPKTDASSHSTLDIFNTGECLSATGLAESADLESWEWQGVIFAPDKDGWDRYCRRINSVIPSGGQYYAFYDGSQSHAENYEERTGLARSVDLRRWESLSLNEPLLVSPHASGSLRYIDNRKDGEVLKLFYEWARADGAHELRMLETDGASFERALRD